MCVPYAHIGNLKGFIQPRKSKTNFAIEYAFKDEQENTLYSSAIAKKNCPKKYNCTRGLQTRSTWLRLSYGKFNAFSPYLPLA